MTTTNYNIRLDQDLKDRSFSVLESYGLTPSQAIRLFLNQVADTNAIPLSFDYQQPKLNAQTLAAIAEVASGNGTKYDSFGDLMSWMKEISWGSTPLLICMSCKKALRKRLMIFLLD